MDQRERANPYEESILGALDGRQAKIWTVMPGIIETFDPVTQTASVQIAIQALQRSSAGSVQWANLPLLVDCPVKFPSGGGCTLTFPVTQGDECEVSFSARCIDAWWQSGGVQPQAEMRMHDLSDGFVEVGPRSKPNVIANISTSAVELRSDDNATKVSLDPAAKTIAMVATGGITINGVTIDQHGNIAQPAGTTADLGGTGGARVARVGDAVSGGVITSGSSKIKAN